MLELKRNPDNTFLLELIVRMPDEAIDRVLVDMVAHDMRRKLEKKRKDGRGGWHTANCTSARLLQMLREHIEKGDMIDVINLAGMIYARQKLFKEDMFEAADVD